jgi:hypothetical protein
MMGSEWILGRLAGGILSVFNLLRVGEVAGLLWIRWWTVGFWDYSQIHTGKQLPGDGNTDRYTSVIKYLWEWIISIVIAHILIWFNLCDNHRLISVLLTFSWLVPIQCLTTEQTTRVRFPAEETNYSSSLQTNSKVHLVS